MTNENQKCPHCGEENPASAVMCWACYTPLGAAKANAPRPELAPADETPTSDKIKHWFSDALPYTAVAGSIASGWLPRKMRLPVLGASLSALLGPMLLDELKNRFAKDKTDDDAMRREAQLAPTARIAETILYYALKEKSTATRIMENGQSVRVNFRIKGEWHEQMIIPRYAWKPIRQHLLRGARRGEFDLTRLDCESGQRDPLKLTKFRAQLETNSQNETLRLQFESAPLEAATGALRFDDAPDVGCLQCGEENLSDAVWCWNCGADLKQQHVWDKKYPIFSALLFAGFAIATSSGWWSPRARWPVLGAGASIIASLLAYAKWDTRREDHKRKNIEDDKYQMVTHDYETSSARLVDDILLRAIQEKLPAIRLQESGNVIVSYEIDEQWRQDKILPGWTWLTLRTALLNRARGKVTCQGREYRFSAELSVNVSGETLVLRFDGPDQAFPTPDEELICANCGEENPAEAVMCWSCYAPVGEQKPEWAE